MNIPKAIEILQLNLKVATKKMPPDVKDALRLLIEAGRFVLDLREGLDPNDYPLLPTETKE